MTGAQALPARPPDPAAVAHLRAADPVMGALLDRLGPELVVRRRTPVGDHYGALVRSIVGQQLSVKAAAAIHARLLAYFDGRVPVPEEILAADPEELRAAAGLSRSKVAFLRSLAEHVVDGELQLDRLESLPDDEVERELVAVKGIGTWTAHMFLMLHLERPDILAWGDLVVRQGMEQQYRLDALPDRPTCERIAAPWSPYRSLGCRLLWASLTGAP